MTTTFYYFGFGSNMLSKRLHLYCNSGERIGPGRLDNYRLDFYSSSRMWFGAPATIVPHENSSVYGAIWEIDMRHLNDLDTREGVNRGVYRPIRVEVYSINREEFIECRAYHLLNQPTVALREFQMKDHIPFDRQPSITYLKTLVKGAIETGLPEEYIEWLRSLKHNGRMVDIYEHKFDLKTTHLLTDFD